MITVLWATFFLLVLLRVPIVFAMGVSGGLALMVGGIPLNLLVQRMVASVDSFALLAVPFFILTGELMEAGGISGRLVRLASTLVGRFRGGLGAVCVVTTTIFSGISGSSASDASAVGSILIPQMIRRGYSRPYAAALQAAAAVNGPIIPPSVLMIVYASIANVSVGAMFLGGFIPGIIVAIGLLIGNFIWARRVGYASEAPAGWTDIARATVDAGWGLMVPVIIMGGIISGIFTATESGAIAAVYSAVVAMFIYRDLEFRRLGGLLLRAVRTTAQVMIIISAAGVFGWLLAAAQFPTQAAATLVALTDDKWIALSLVILFLLVIGCIMEILAAAIILIPVLFPIAAHYGFDQVHFAVVMVIAMALGSVTPPVGVTLYVTLGIADSNIREVNPYIWYFVAIIVVVLMLVAFVPATVLVLPHTFGLG
jgi:tripartite ATP-independent transporter DctM subunit